MDIDGRKEHQNRKRDFEGVREREYQGTLSETLTEKMSLLNVSAALTARSIDEKIETNTGCN